MINFVKDGNILEADTEVVVNTVNCVGVMGKGLALQFKQAFPGNFKSYKVYCDVKLLKPGKIYVYIEDRGRTEPLTIVNFATKDHWRNPSKIEWIKSGLSELDRMLRDLDYRSCAIPALGCCNGGLWWEDVKPLIVDMCNNLPKVRFEIYEPR